MQKGFLGVGICLLAGLVLIGGVWAQGTTPSGVFTGIITMVDPEGKGIVVQNNDGEMFFRLSGETIINGSPVGEGGLRPDSLKEGMIATVSYMETRGNILASRIDVETSSVGTSKGWELPFGCGLSVC